MNLAAAQFVLFGPDHLAVMVLAAALPAGLILWTRLSRCPSVERTIRLALAAILVVNEVAYWVYGMTVSSDVRTYLANFLPLHLCGVAVFVTAWALVRPTTLVCEAAYFWGLAGTLQAIITPEVKFAFPDYRFIEFFINHVGIVTGALFVVLAMRRHPRPGALVRMFLLTNGVLAVAALADWLIGPGANYMYMREPPRAASPMFFLPWPWYILFLELLGVAMIALLNLPFWWGRRRHAA